MGKRERNRGAVAERELAALLTDALGVVVKRKLGAARDGGSDMDVGPFAIESKRQERVQIEAWLAQAIANAGQKTPVVCWRRNGGQWYAALRLSDFLPLMQGEL